MVMGQGRPGGVQPRQRHCYMLRMAVKNALLLLERDFKGRNKCEQPLNLSEKCSIYIVFFKFKWKVRAITR